MAEYTVGTLATTEKGNRYVIVDTDRPTCGRCGQDLKFSSDLNVFWCSISKRVYCYDCAHSKTFWSCAMSHKVDEHIDWLCSLIRKGMEARIK